MIAMLPACATFTSAELRPMKVSEMDISHHFGGGMYIKETNFKAGEWGEKHTHSFDHLSVLASGRVQLTVDNVSVEIEGPKILTVQAGKVHQVLALTDVITISSSGVISSALVCFFGLSILHKSKAQLKSKK